MKKWIERRSNHFLPVGQANQRGKENTRILHEGDSGFSLEMRKIVLFANSYCAGATVYVGVLLPVLIEMNVSVWTTP